MEQNFIITAVINSTSTKFNKVLYIIYSIMYLYGAAGTESRVNVHLLLRAVVHVHRGATPNFKKWRHVLNLVIDYLIQDPTCMLRDCLVLSLAWWYLVQYLS
eukprot:SAG31_NODE_16_length_36206_cov_27.355728_4_plen_102_part_00